MSFKSIPLTGGRLKKAVDLLSATPTLGFGDKVVVGFEGVADGSTVNVFINNAALKNRLIAPADWQGPVYSIPWTVDVPPGDYNLIFEQRLHGTPVAKVVGKITVKAVAGSSDADADATPADDTIDTLPYLFGICGGTIVSPDLPVASALWQGTKPHSAVLAGAGVVGFRDWWSCIGNAEEDVKHQPNWNRVRALKRAGLAHAVLDLAKGNWPKGAKVPTAQQSTASAIAIVATIPADVRSMLEFEVGNEQMMVNSTGDDYWPGTTAEFVTNFFNPFCTVLQAAGYRVILGGLNGGNPAKDLKALLDLGLRKPNAIGYHPYAQTDKVYKDKTLALVEVAGDLPLIETESNSSDGPDYKAGKKNTAAVAANQRAIDVVRRTIPQVKAVYEFSLEKQSRTMTGPLGWYDIVRENNVAVSATTSDLFNVRFASKFA